MNVEAYKGLCTCSLLCVTIDDVTMWYLLSRTYEALNMFKFMVGIETQLELRVKTLRIDHVREYLYDIFKEFVMHRQLTILGTPQQNGIAEHLKCILLDMAR